MALAGEMDDVPAATAGTVDRHDTDATFGSTDPATGAVVGVFPVHGADAVTDTVRSGMTSIHSVLTFASVPSLPFGGVGGGLAHGRHR